MDKINEIIKTALEENQIKAVENENDLHYLAEEICKIIVKILVDEGLLSKG